MDKNSIQQLQHGDFTKISLKSGLSHSTVRKWYNGELKLPESTEYKILKAAVEVITDRNKEMQSWIAKGRGLAQRIKQFETKISTSIALSEKAASELSASIALAQAATA